MHTNLSVTVAPANQISFPVIIVGLDNQTIFKGKLTETKTFTIDQDLCVGQHKFWIKHLLSNNDQLSFCQRGSRITEIRAGNISTDRMRWAGEFTPVWSEPWASEQRAQGIELQQKISSCDHLCVNGEWVLNFTTPIYSWIHQLENLGWVYD